MDGAAVRLHGQVGDGGEIPVALPGVDEGRQGGFPLAPDDEIGVLQGLVGQVGDVRAAHEDGDAHGPDLVGDGVGPGRRRGDGGDADEVGRGEDVVVDLAEVLDEDLDLPAALLHHRPQDERPQARQGELGKDVEVRGLRLDENDLRHRLVLLGGLGPFPVLGLEGQDVLSLLLEQVLPALDALLEELHLVEKSLDGREQGREPLFDLGLREGVRPGLDRDERPDVVRDGLDLLERVAEELEVADELAEKDVVLRIEPEAAFRPHVRLDDALVLPVLDRPRADAGALGQVPDGEEAVLDGRLLPAVAVPGQADLLDDLEDLLGAVAEVRQPLDVGDMVEAGRGEERGLPVGEAGRLEELDLGPFGQAL